MVGVFVMLVTITIVPRLLVCRDGLDEGHAGRKKSSTNGNEYSH